MCEISSTSLTYIFISLSPFLPSPTPRRWSSWGQQTGLLYLYSLAWPTLTVQLVLAVADVRRGPWPSLSSRLSVLPPDLLHAVPSSLNPSLLLHLLPFTWSSSLTRGCFSYLPLSSSPITLFALWVLSSSVNTAQMITRAFQGVRTVSSFFLLLLGSQRSFCLP